MNGIEPIIVARANELASLSARGEDLVTVCAKLSRAETDALEEAVSIYLMKPASS
jgi:DNA mismatch repair protein MSH5